MRAWSARHARYSGAEAVGVRNRRAPASAGARLTGVYSPVTFSSMKVRVLQPGELDGEAIFDVAHHAAGVLPMVTAAPTGGRRSGLIAMAAPDADMSMTRQATLVPFGRIRRADRIARHETAVAAVFRQIEDLPVGEPGELGGELVALARGRRDGHGKAVVELARDHAFQPAEMVDIGDHAFAELPDTGAINAMPPGDMLMTWQGNSRRSASM